MVMAEAFAEIALAISGVLGGPFVAGRVVSIGEVQYDDGGSIIPGSGPTYRACSLQVDSASEAMRRSEGFAEQDQRILILAAGFDGTVTSDDRVEVLEGPYAGTWGIESVARDPAGAYFEVRGRRG